MKANLELIPILLAEDDPDDVAITQRALKKANILNPLYVVRDGEEVMEYLEHRGRYGSPEKAPRPGLILLDLNMPRMNGREVLKEVKGNPALRRIPIVILTTSKQEEDIIRSYDDGANTYITKPVEFHQFMEIVQALGRYWLCIAEIPTDKR